MGDGLGVIRRDSEPDGRTVVFADVTADGKRILAIAIPEATRPRRIEVVTLWTPELARLSP